MFKVGTNVIGIGDCGINAVNKIIPCSFSGLRTITVGGDVVTSKAEFAYQTKHEMMANAQKHYMSDKSTSIIVADCSIPCDASLACEVCAISSMMKALTIAFVKLPDSADVCYDAAKEYVDELHEVCNSVVIINQGYSDGFVTDFESFLMAVSYALDVNANKRISSYEELCGLFTQKNDMYFASLVTPDVTDSHKYRSTCLSLKLESQLHIDIANNWIYIVASNGDINKEVVAEYINAIDKKNIACMPQKKLCISENNSHIGRGEFLFAVLCAH